jgi:hypothetical protein
MTGYQRCLETLACRRPDRVPAYTPTIASDVASRILGRPAHTGGPGLWYAEAEAWCRGESCFRDLDAVQQGGCFFQVDPVVFVVASIDAYSVMVSIRLPTRASAPR